MWPHKHTSLLRVSTIVGPHVLIEIIVLQVAANARCLKRGRAERVLKLPTTILSFRHELHGRAVSESAPFKLMLCFQSLLLEPIPDHELYYVQVAPLKKLLRRFPATSAPRRNANRFCSFARASLTLSSPWGGSTRKRDIANFVQRWTTLRECRSSTSSTRGDGSGGMSLQEWTEYAVSQR